MTTAQWFPVATGNTTFRQAVWIFPLAFCLHVAEEWPSFVAWAQRHAWVGFSEQQYLVIHVSGLAGAIAAATLLSRFSSRRLVFIFFAFLFLPGLFWNVLFHAGASAITRTYCPGLLTALLFYPTVVYVVSVSAVREGLISSSSWVAALGIAGIFHVWEVGHNVFKAW